MALQKEITNNKGITANYHRIASISNDSGLVDIYVLSYISKEYREQELALFEIKSKEAFYVSEIERLRELEENISEDDKVYLHEIENKLNALYNSNMDETRWVFNNYYTIEVDNTDDISFKEIYSKLKEMEVYSGALDV